MLAAYRSRHRLPHERTHDYLKQVSAVVAAAGGAKNVKLSDFNLAYQQDEEAPPDDNVVVVDFKPRGSRKRATL